MPSFSAELPANLITRFYYTEHLFTLMLILWVTIGIVAPTVDRYFHANVGLNELELFILLVALVIMSLFFIARFNKIMAAAASITATGVMILLLSIVHIPH